MPSDEILSLFGDIHGKYLILADFAVDMLEEGVWGTTCACKLFFRLTLIYLVQIKSLHHEVSIRSSRDQIDLRTNACTLLRDGAFVELESSNGGGVVSKVGERLIVVLSIVD